MTQREVNTKADGAGVTAAINIKSVFKNAPFEWNKSRIAFVHGTKHLKEPKILFFVKVKDSLV